MAKTVEDEEARLREIQRIVTESTVHYFPQGRPGTTFGIEFSENYLLWGLAQFSPLLERFGLAPLDPYEFLDGEKNWERGAGLCGQLASIMIYLARDAGIQAGKAGLGGHVIAVARLSDGREFVVDPDYGFTLEGSLDEVARQPQRIVDAIVSGGKHSNDVAQEAASFYGPEHNIVFWEGDRTYRPLGWLTERAAYIGIWAVPFLLVFAGVLLMRRASPTPRRTSAERELGPASVQDG